MKIGSTDIVNCKIGSVQVNEVRIGSTLVWQFSSLDPDAQAFITAAGITNPTQQTAINTLVVSLKSNSLWAKMSAIYPFVGGTATSHKFNLKNPLDTNAAFRLVFFGGGTHSANGYQTNGTNAYAESYYNPSINLSNINSNHISIYSRTNNSGGIDMGGGAGAVLVDLELRYAATSYNWNMSSYFSHTNSDSRGLYINTRTASNSFKLIKNGSAILGSSTGAAGATKPNITYHIGKRNYDPLWSNRQYAFASIGDGLTDTDATNFYTAVQAFQTSLGRSVGPQTVSDADAQAFVTAANIQDQVQADAVNNLVIGLKADGLWTKMKAIYPFVGGDATSHKWNLKNPLDTDAAFRLSFVGGWTHSATGALANGTNAYADTFLSINILNQNNSHLSIYNTNNYGPYATGSIDIGAFNETTVNGTFIATEVITGLSRARLFKNPLDFSLTDNRGYFLVNSNSTNSQYYINNVVRSTIANSGVFPLDNLNIYIGNLKTNTTLTYFAFGRYTFSSIGNGLSSTDASNLYTRVQAFQTTLGRQV